jgi:hypothetical protein
MWLLCVQMQADVLILYPLMQIACNVVYSLLTPEAFIYYRRNLLYKRFPVVLDHKTYTPRRG